MVYVAFFSLLLSSVLLQTSVAPSFAILGVKPDLVLLFVLIVGTVRGFQEAAAAGAIGGLLMDIISGAPMGANSIPLIAVALAVADRKVFLGENRFVVTIVLAFCCTFLYDALFLLFLQLLGSPVEWSITLARILLPSAVLNSLIAPFALWALRGLAREKVAEHG